MTTLSELGLPKSLVELPSPCQAAMTELLETAATIPSGNQPQIDRKNFTAVQRAGELNMRIKEFLVKRGGRRDPLQALESYAEQAQHRAEELGRSGRTDLNMEIHKYATSLAIVADQPEFLDNIPLAILQLYAMGGYDGDGQTELQIAV